MSNVDKQLANGGEKHTGKVRTDMYCHDCNKNFLATIDYDVDGNHEVICPHCGHYHCRVVKSGVVTNDRWDSRLSTTKTRTEKVWTDSSLKMQTSTASHFLRERWLNYGR